jgi:Pyruvate/2-oxoacid:ferredoxin oxidoreductase delta subunit
MATRKLVRIDEEKCDGCGLCVPACDEGAIQVIDGKAKLVSDVYCDGLGACLGHCPQGAISIEETEARPFDEEAVKRHLAASASDSAAAGSSGPVALEGFQTRPRAGAAGGCPGSRSQSFAAAGPAAAPAGDSALGHWPVQLHLISPHAPQYQGADLLLCADCVPFALPTFHQDHLKGRSLAIACPKLDQGQDSYLEKLVALIDEAGIRSLRVVVMEVPCCNGLLALARAAAERARRPIPIEYEVVSVRGQRVAAGAA